MQELKLTFDHITDEADALEIDVVFWDGYFSLSKRGTCSPRFMSKGTYDEPFVLEVAMFWLKQYRLLIEQADQQRSLL